MSSTLGSLSPSSSISGSVSTRNEASEMAVSFRDAINYDSVSMCGMLPDEWDAKATAISSLGNSTIDPTEATETVFPSSLSLAKFIDKGQWSSERDLIDIVFTERIGVSFLKKAQIEPNPALFDFSMDVDSFRYVTRGLRLLPNFDPLLLINSNKRVSTDNHLSAKVRVFEDVQKMKLSQLPNFVMFQGGRSKMFSISIFFPGLISMEDGRYNSLVSDGKQERWFNEFMWPALNRFSRNHTRQRIPPSYAMARNSAYLSVGVPIDDGILPEVVTYLREITADDDDFADFFFYISAANLKSMAIDSMDIWFNHFNPMIVEHINWRDYFVDVGFNCTLKRPNAYEPSKTLLFHMDNLSQLVSNCGYRDPTLDTYAHSSTVGGVRALHSTVNNTSHVVYLQAYHTDKSCTYEGSGQNMMEPIKDRDLVEGTNKYKRIIKKLQTAYEHARMTQFGVRLEVICSVQAADYILKRGPGPILDTLLKHDTLLAHKTGNLMDYKLLILTGLDIMVQRSWTLRCPKIPRGRIRLLQFILYYMKALGSRPDDGGSYTELAEELNLETAVQCYNRPIVDTAFRFEDAVLNIGRTMKIDELYGPQVRKKQRLDDNDGADVDERDPRSLPRQAPPLSNEEAIRRVLKQFASDFYTSLPIEYVAVDQHLKEPPTGFRREEIERYISSVIYRKGNYNRKYEMLFSPAVHRGGRWKNVSYLKLIESYNAVPHLDCEIIMNGIKAKVDTWHAVPSAETDRLWKSIDGRLIMTLTGSMVPALADIVDC